jgi:hypothetical protein
MNTSWSAQILSGGAPSSCAERRLKVLGIQLPAPPEPSDGYVEAVQTGNPLLLSWMLPTEGHGAKSLGASARSWVRKRGARRVTSRRSTSLPSRSGIWGDRLTERLFFTAAHCGCLQ